MSDMKQKISLIGIGTGKPDMLTGQALRAITEADCLIGASRMLEFAGQVLKEQNTGKQSRKPFYEEYRAESIMEYIRAHTQYKHLAVLFSGDTGFYSGAGKLAGMLEKNPDLYEMEMIPGISSIIFLAARLHTSWDDAALISLHGQNMNFIQTVNRNSKTFLLLGGKDTGKNMIQKLKSYDMEHVKIYIGSRLSYSDERIISGSCHDLEDTDADGLCAAMIWNPSPEKYGSPHLKDSGFIRGSVPMTKEEVRAVVIASLELTENAVVYDIGAGTGSVSVEAARCSDRIRVYAIEKNPEALQLINQNRKKFRTDGIHIIEGSAPEVLSGLEAPTHVFVGGSSGKLREIIHIIKDKNPQARIVISAVSLETMSEILKTEKEGLLKNLEVTQICASRARTLGRYHMMTGQNPVYVVRGDIL